MSFFKGYGKGKGDTVIKFDPTKVATQETQPTDNKFWIDTSNKK